MLVSYPALFYYDDSSKNVPFYVSFPDFDSPGTQGKSVPDAISLASDWLGINVADYIENNRELPTASDINLLSLTDNNPYPGELNYNESLSFISMVLVDLSEYMDADKPVKKTLTIPRWADKVGKELKLNFSETLTNAIAEKKLKQKM